MTESDTPDGFAAYMGTPSAHVQFESSNHAVEDADLYNLNDIGLAMRVDQTRLA